MAREKIMASELGGYWGNEYPDTTAFHSRLGAVWLPVYVGFYPVSNDYLSCETKEGNSPGNITNVSQYRG